MKTFHCENCLSFSKIRDQRVVPMYANLLDSIRFSSNFEPKKFQRKFLRCSTKRRGGPLFNETFSSLKNSQWDSHIVLNVERYPDNFLVYCVTQFVSTWVLLLEELKCGRLFRPRSLQAHTSEEVERSGVSRENRNWTFRIHLIIWMFKTANKLIHLFSSTCLHALHPLSIVKMLDHLSLANWNPYTQTAPTQNCNTNDSPTIDSRWSAGRRVLHRLHRSERPDAQGLLLSSRWSVVLLWRCTEQVLLQPNRATRTAAESVGTVGPNQRAQH